MRGERELRARRYTGRRRRRKLAWILAVAAISAAAALALCVEAVSALWR